MKKIIYTSLMLASLAATSTSLSANDCARPLHGFTIGASIGHDQGSIRVRRNYLTTPNNVDKLRLSTQGVLGQISLSYGWYLNNFYVAPEITGAISSANGKVHTNPTALINSTFKVNQRGTFGAGLKIGRMFHHVLPHLTLGYANTKFQVVSDSLITPTDYKAHKNVGGFRAGLGVCVPVNKHFSFDASYAFTTYNKFHKSHTDTVTYSIRPTENTFMLGVKYSM
jgi:opacity protein-like surface antigen